jgi:undecaprenyl-diphosphatase
LSSILEHSAVAYFDEAVDHQFEALRSNNTANRLFYGLSEAANHSLLWHGLTWTRALLFPRRRRDAVEISLALGLESALVNGPIKMLFRRERPQVSGARPHKLRQPHTSSFPSGHATSAICAALLLSRRSKFWPFYWVLAALVAVSRIHVRIHHASDVVGGALVGFGLGTFFRQMMAAATKNAERH